MNYGLCIATYSFEITEAGGDAINVEIVDHSGDDLADEEWSAVTEEIMMDERLIEERLKDPTW